MSEIFTMIKAMKIHSKFYPNLTIFRFDENFAFDRTESRLIEMESPRYREMAAKHQDKKVA